MKPTTLISFLLIFALTTYIPLAFSQERVKDTNGDSLHSDGRYYILPALRGPGGGGVSLGKTGNETCPVTVLQARSEIEKGKRVQFKHFPDNGIIYEAKPLDISFEDIENSCADSTDWVVVSGDFPTQWVGIGGVSDHPGNKIVYGSFEIQKYEDVTYKFVFRADFAGRPANHTVDIGRRDDKNGKRLILAEKDEPIFLVTFVPADDDDDDDGVGIKGIKSVRSLDVVQ